MSVLRVAVVQGGPSSEAEVSRVSATGVARALAARGHAAVRLELDEHLAESIRTGAYDVAFPAVHGAIGEDGSLQGLLEVLEVPYVGSGVFASALAMNKAAARRVLALEGVPIARGFSARAPASPEAVADRALGELEGGVVVKPAEGGSAIGVGRFESRPDRARLAEAVARAFSQGDEIVIEAFVRGAEVTCGVLEDDGGARALPPTEIRAPKDVFYNFEARYTPGRSEHVCPAELGGKRAEVEALARRAHAALGCRDLSRVDFVVGDAIAVLEVNTLPGFTPTSLFPEAAAASGLSYEALCDGLVRRALARGVRRKNRAVVYPV